jgi:hypothetical protein
MLGDKESDFPMPVGVDGSADPLPCTGVPPDCDGEHGSVVVEGPSAINMAAPLVCDVETGDCLSVFFKTTVKF